ncbi:MAG: hypothetical protein WBD40_12145 [Tepidisphaeraceae bacterium]
MRTSYTLSLFMLTTMYLTAAAAEPATSAAADASSPTLLSVERIWDKAPHNAFTDLIRFEDQWVCAFREAPAHKGGVRGSRIRVLASADAKAWASVGELAHPRGDIRDAKMAILPDGRLTLLTAIQLFDQKAGQTHQSIAFFTRDLKSWEGPIDVAEPNFWLWGIRWHPEGRNGVGYSIGYGTGGTRLARLFQTRDGVKFERVGEPFDVPSPFPNESAIVFDADDTARALLRFDPDVACIGSARPPYTQWTWKPSALRVGGPELMRTPDGRLLGGGRLWVPKPRMSLFWVEPETGTITECLTLPSGGDTSYPGFVWHDDVLHLSYYSSHEGGKSSIYFARVRLPEDRRALAR